MEPHPENPEWLADLYRRLGIEHTGIILTEAGGVATAAHEVLGHYAHRTGKIPPRALRQIADFLGVESDNWTAQQNEDLAQLVESYLLHGGPRNSTAVPQRLREAFDSIAEEMRRNPEVDPMPENLRDALDLMLLADGPHGTAYEPFRRGLPLPVRKGLQRGLGSVRARLSYSGRRSAIGRLWSDPTTRKQFKAALLRSGLFEANVVNTALEQQAKALKLDAAVQLRRALLSVARPMPESADEIALKINPGIETSGKLGRYFDLVRSVDQDAAFERIGAKELGSLSDRQLDEIVRELTPAEIAGMTTQEAAARMVVGELAEPIENIVWVPREIVDKSHLFEPPNLLRAKRSAYSKAIQAGAFTVDLANDLLRTSLLYLNPAYYGMNLAGNLVMNMLQQGPFSLINLPKAARLSYTLDDGEAWMIDLMMGEGWASIAHLRSSLVAGKPSNALSSVANMLVDRIPRRAAWLHEARRVGLRSEESVSKLLKAAEAGDAASRDLVDYITQNAKDEIVDFDNLTPFERDFVSRIIFVYPWIKGSIRYTLRFPLNHPLQAQAFALMYLRQQELSNQEVGDGTSISSSRSVRASASARPIRWGSACGRHSPSRRHTRSGGQSRALRKVSLTRSR